MDSKTVLIAGAGIGGLTAALSLMQAGHKVKVFEQAPELSEVGAGIQLSANATKVLKAIGVLDEVKLRAVAPKRVETRLYDSGEKIFAAPQGLVHRLAFGAPYLHIHRADLHTVLAEHLQKQSPGAVLLNAGVKGFSEDASGVTLELTDGRSYQGDMLIGADGVKSVIREQIHGKEEPNWTGNLAWRGVVLASRLPKDFMDRQVTVFVGPGKHFVVYYLRNQELVNFVGVVEDDPDWREESWTLKAPWDELKKDFAGWHPTVQTLIDAMDRDECYRWALYNRLPIENWSTHKATLLGDSAHATLPFFAQGAAMAIEDAWVLRRSLSECSDVSTALQKYQGNRIERTARIQKRSTKNGELFHQQDIKALRESFTSRTGKQEARAEMKWVYSYNPLKVELS
ncbi:FAD-dependent monooxygenase [Maricurvus nonylphenolicus]|uniref:FAD-dependent monooxygenase n=1 Tax=Maricurvus nonylphenolicus TaxID=1008307 RepID=UPI0036F19678